MKKKSIVFGAIFLIVVLASGLTACGGDDNKNYVAVNEITAEKEELHIEVNATDRIVAAVLPSNATEKKLTYTSQNTNIATVDSNGVVTGKSSGKTNIVIKGADNKNKTIRVVVSDSIERIDISVRESGNLLKSSTIANTYVFMCGVETNIRAGEIINTSIRLNANVVPSTALDELVFTSSDEKVAVVDEEGVVTFTLPTSADKRDKKVTITATSTFDSGKSGEINFIVAVYDIEAKLKIGKWPATVDSMDVPVEATALAEYTGNGIVYKPELSNLSISIIEVNGEEKSTCNIIYTPTLSYNNAYRLVYTFKLKTNTDSNLYQVRFRIVDKCTGASFTQLVDIQIKI